MLASLQLTNYRCFQRHEVPFRALNIIVGANNAGKSTLVEALRLVGLVTGRYRSIRYDQPPAWSGLPTKRVGIYPSTDGIDLRGGSVFHRYGDPPATVVARFSDDSRVEVHVGPQNEVFGLIYDQGGSLIKSKSRAAQVSIPRIAILPQIGPLLENEPLLSRDHVLRSAGTALASWHFRNQMHYLQSEYFDDFRIRAERSWHQLHIESLNVEGSPPEQTLSFHVRDTNFVAEIGWMGHGLQMWLQTMWFLARSADAETVILDEPDVYMHADLQRRLVRLLRSRPGQTVIATHSVEIMSEVEPDNILIVDKSRRSSSFAASLPAVQHTIDRLGGVHNIHLARLWGSQRCLHVEGDDIAFLKAFQDILYPESGLSFDVIPRLSIGGWSGWSHAIGSAMSLQNAAGETMVAYCLLDSDYHTDDEISQRYEEASRHKVQLHIWRMKEIENYLLIPSAIVRVISTGLTDGRKGPSANQVQQKIDEIAVQMKDSIFDALSHEYYVRDRASGVACANRKARERLDQAWKTREGRSSVIPGKGVIADLSGWAKDTFGVSFGALRIARELKPDEIPEEMKSVIGAIEHARTFPPALSQRVR